MTPNDYESLGRVAYSLISGAVLMAAVAVLFGSGYAWYRLIGWAIRRAWPPKRS